MKKFYFLVIILLINFNSVFAQWVHSGGPEGIDIRSILLFDNGSILVYSLSTFSYTTNNGDSWQQATMNGIASDDRFALGKFVSSGNALIFWSLDYKKVYRSTNLGNTWSEVTISGLGTNNVMDAFVFNDKLHLKVIDGFFISTDDGQTWTKETVSNSKLSSNTVISNNKWIDAGSGGVFYSTNNGSTWSNASGSVGSSYVRSLAKVGNNIFALTLDELHISSDDGLTWTSVDDQNRSMDKLFVLNNQLYVTSSENGITQVDETGKIFTPKNNGLADLNVNQLAAKGTIFFAGTSSGMYRSGTAGEAWSRANKGIGYADINDFVMLNDVLFVATQFGVWRSSSYGQRWIPTNSIQVKFNSVAAIGNNLYGATRNDGVFVSTDMGTSFTKLDNNYPRVVDPKMESTNGDLFITAYQGNDRGTYVLRGGTGNWQKVSGVSGGIAAWRDPDNGNIYLSRSKGDGTTFSGVSGITTTGQVYDYARAGNTIYAGAYIVSSGNSPLYRSTDGSSFSSFTSGIVANTQTVPSMTAKGDTLYLIGDIINGNSTIYELMPGATQLSKFDLSGLPDAKVHNIYYNGYSLFASSLSGVYRYDLKSIPPVDDDVDVIEYPPLVMVDVTLKSLSVTQGTLAPVFNSSTLNYTVTLPDGTTEVPVVNAEANDPDATVAITQASFLNGGEAERTAIVVVTGEDGTTTQTTTVLFDNGSEVTELVLEVPNQFSPNGDTIDDLWIIPEIDRVVDNNLAVFNRSGQLVYETNNYQNTWDGSNLNGNPLIPGVYFYIIKDANNKAIKTGAINLLR